MKLTFGSAKAELAKAIGGLNANDPRVLTVCNQAQEDLLYEGYWKDTHSRYVVCVTDGCLTWPREIQTIEAASMCDMPITVRNEWYEFLENGPGQICSDCGPCLTLVDRGNAVAFDDVTITGTKLAVYADGSEAAGATILVRYYNSLAGKVYTDFNGETIEGERITIPTAGNYAYSTYEVMPFGLYEVIKPVTKRPIRLYQYTIVGGALKPLAYYEPDETLPDYRRSLVPSLTGSTGGSCTSTKLTVAGKRRFVPAINDDSVLMIQHERALKLACQAISKEDRNLHQEASACWALAAAALDRQLRHHQGTGAVVPMRIVNMDGRGEGVMNLV